MLEKSILTFVLTAAGVTAHAQTAGGRTLAERLGYDASAKLVILHVDDLGETHSVNAAAIAALEAKRVNSASIMVPCPWFPEIAAYARKHPEIDWGLHLTLTSERTDYRWGPVSSRKDVPSLLDENGYFHKRPDEALKHINPKEAELELRAQIARAKAFGFPFTHLDTHQLLLYQTPELTELLFRLAKEHDLVATQMVEDGPTMMNVAGALKPEERINKTVSIGPSVPPEGWEKFYLQAAGELKPGVTAFVVHLAYDDAEMRAFSSDRPTWGAAWRQRDLDVVLGEPFRKALKESRAVLITWGDIRNKLAKEKK